MATTDIDRVREKIDIVELISEYIPLKKAGRNWRANCPFHGEKTPSFMVSAELQIFKCFGCSEGGNIFKFLMRMEGMEFGEALTYLAKKAGVQLTEFKPDGMGEIRSKLFGINAIASEFYHFVLTKHPAGKEALEYLKSRSIGEEAVEVFKLGWAPNAWDSLTKYLIGKKGFKHEELTRVGLAGLSSGSRKLYDRFRRRLVFPLKNHRGDVVGFAGRLLPGDAEEGKTGKYINTSETEIYHKSEILYGLDVTRAEIKKVGVVVVVEGEIDMISSFQAGVRNVVAIKGSALTEDQTRLLKRFCDELVLALDADMAGDMAVRRGIAMAEKMGFSIKVLEKMGGFKDPDEFARGDPGGYRKAISEAVGIYDFYIDSTVTKYGVGDASAKKKISRELIPIWAEISDEITKSHYVKKLAGVLGVGEEAVWSEINKLPNSKLQISNNDKGQSDMVEKKTRREVLEEYLMALIFYVDPLRLLDEGMTGVVGGMWGKKVIGEMDKFRKKGSKKFDMKMFIEGLPDELKGGVSKLLLHDFNGGNQWAQVEIDKTKMEISRLDLKERLEKLSGEIAIGEGRGDDVSGLQREFSSLSKHLTDVI